MVFDSIASIPTAASNAKDFAKKKRANRSAKLKQCKLDARREQWLSQVKNKGGKEELNNGGKIALPSMHERGERGRSIGKLEINSGGEENEGLMSNNYSDSESSPSNSPTSSVLGSNGSGTNFTGSSRSSSSSNSGGCCSGSITEEDEGDDGCLDDWEAVADALAADDTKDEPDNPNLESPEQENATQFDSAPAPKPEGTVRMALGNRRAQPNCRAWRPDDAFRPQSLPNLLKQHSFPMNSERHCGRGWVCKNVVSAPSSCPICCEDLDLTDSSFLPCSCGFRLCLFCHKRILEEDGRCPGCRKQYDQPVEGEVSSDGNSLTFKLARSCSMITRS